MSVSAVLESTGVDPAVKSRIMNAFNRLVEKLHRTEQEKDTATLQLKGELLIEGFNLSRSINQKDARHL